MITLAIRQSIRSYRGDLCDRFTCRSESGYYSRKGANMPQHFEQRFETQRREGIGSSVAECDEDSRMGVLCGQWLMRVEEEPQSPGGMMFLGSELPQPASPSP